MANEKRLIDANALCEFFQERYEYLRNASETQLPNGNVSIDLDLQVGAIIAKEFLDKAKQAQTVDAVEVVRCKDCHWWRLVNKRNGCGICSHEVFSIDDCTVDPVTEPNDFCFYGERKDGE